MFDKCKNLLWSLDWRNTIFKISTVKLTQTLLLLPNKELKCPSAKITQYLNDITINAHRKISQLFFFFFGNQYFQILTVKTLEMCCGYRYSSRTLEFWRNNKYHEITHGRNYVSQNTTQIPQSPSFFFVKTITCFYWCQLKRNIKEDDFLSLDRFNNQREGLASHVLPEPCNPPSTCQHVSYHIRRPSHRPEPPPCTKLLEAHKS